MDVVRGKRYISFSSGGTAGFSFIGCMHALEMLMGPSTYALWMDDIRGVAGTSAGALYGLVFALRLTHRQVADVHKNLDLRRCVSFTNIDQCHTKLGFSDMDYIRQYIHAILEEGGLSKNATMADLHRFTRLECVFRASNVMTRRAENISHTSHGGMRIDDAVCASCAIPLLYHPIEYDGAHLVDGCLTGPLADVFERDSTLFLKIRIAQRHDTRTGLVDYISALFSLASEQACRVREDEIFVLDLRNTAGFDPYASHQDVQREGFLAALTTFTGVDVWRACALLCREYVRNVWEFTGDEEVPPEEAAPPVEDGRSEGRAPSDTRAQESQRSTHAP